MKAVIKFYRLFRNARLLALLCTSLLVSCGDPLTTAGIGGTGISYGTVTDFGSIILNGSHLDDSSATVTLDGSPGDGSLHGGIKLGMVVKVTGTFSGNTGTAISIEYRDNLEGPVCDAPASVDGIRILRVLGQTVILDATTIVDNSATIDTIEANDIVEVSGLTDATGQIHASYIEVKNTTEFEVKGQVDTVSGSILTINDLTVNFRATDIADGTPSVGQFVEVKGTIFSCSSSTDSLTATSVELEPEGAGAIPAGAHTEIEGFITNIDQKPDSFMIGNRQVATNNSTRYLPEGFDIVDIKVGIKVEAEGTFDNGVLSATKIVFRENVRLESDVATVNGSSFTLVGLTGIIITTNSATEPPGVTVTLGNHIRVRGVEGPNDTVLATRIDDKSGDIDAFVQGSVQSKAGTVITVLGIDFDTNSISEFEDVNEIPISQTTFLSLVEPGTLVKFQGEIAGSTITYLEAELEDD